MEVSPTQSNSTPPDYWRGFGATLTVLILSGLALMLVSHRFAMQEIEFNQSQNTQPRVTHVRPADGEQDVLPDEAIALDLRLPGKQAADAKLAGADPLTLSGVTFTDARGNAVEAAFAVSAAGDAITISPRSMLTPGMTYQIAVTPQLKDLAGRSFEPFSSAFTIARNITSRSIPVAFNQEPQSVEPLAYLALTFGPDGRLYAGTFAGQIVRFDLSPDGSLVNPKTITTLVDHAGGPRMITGLLFDQNSTPQDPRLYVSHGQFVPPNNNTIEGAEDFTGSITLITGNQLDTAQDLITGLPRGYKDHLNFQMAFGPDGAIYFNQGSHTSVGSPDNKWGQRPERLLTAAILRLDLTKLKSAPLDVRTGEAGTYDPYANDAPLTLHATGVRSAYDILLHSNGHLYTAINGAAAGGNLPERPANPNRAPPYRSLLNRIDELDHTTDDTLVLVKPGKYYGHPNPRRDQYVLMGGNPTDKPDPYEVPQYPVETFPEPDFQLPVLNFGKNRSANGMVEYTADTFGPALKGAMIIARFSAGGDLIAVFPKPDGSVSRVLSEIKGFKGFSQPLDLALNPDTGILYVSEFGTRGITLLRPTPGNTSNVIERRVD